MTKRGNRATDKEKRRCTGESTRAVYIATATVCQYNTVDARSGAGDSPGGGGGCEGGGGGGGGLVVVRCLRCYDTILREISHLQEKTIIPDSAVRAPRLALGSSRRRRRDVSLRRRVRRVHTYIHTTLAPFLVSFSLSVPPSPRKVRPKFLLCEIASSYQQRRHRFSPPNFHDDLLSPISVLNDPLSLYPPTATLLLLSLVSNVRS